MTNAKRATSLSRDQAAAIYEDLRKNFAAFSGNANPAASLKASKVAAGAQGAYTQAAGQRRPASSGPSAEEQMLALMMAKHKAQSDSRAGSGSRIAILMVLLAAGFKLTLGVIEHTGVLGAEFAQASIIADSPRQVANNSAFSPEQVALLKALDGRRAELEERRRGLDKREEDMTNRDREFAVKLAELRELTQSLKGNREADSKKRTAQLDQLSNVYGSMDPKEASQLIEQLDEPIALELLNRMPEKRIGQILTFMNKEKALLMTRMLSSGTQAK